MCLIKNVQNSTKGTSDFWQHTSFSYHFKMTRQRVTYFEGIFQHSDYILSARPIRYIVDTIDFK